jgi:hypothetical protein
VPAPTQRGHGCHSHIGFNAISTLAEDKVNPERDISVASVLVCLIQTEFCPAMVCVAAPAWPDWRTCPESEPVILNIARRARGPWMGKGRDGVISRRAGLWLRRPARAEYIERCGMVNEPNFG